MTAVLLNNTFFIDRTLAITRAVDAVHVVADLATVVKRDFPVVGGIRLDASGEEIVNDATPAELQGKVMFADEMAGTVSGPVTSSQAAAQRQDEVERTLHIGNIAQHVRFSAKCLKSMV
jgi:hypothetical protein